MNGGKLYDISHKIH